MIKYLVAHHHILKSNMFVLLPFKKTDKWYMLHGSIFFSLEGFPNKRVTAVEFQQSNAH